MKLVTRIKKVESLVNSSSELEDARAFVGLYLQLTDPGNIPPNFNPEEEAKRLAAEGVGLRKLLGDIAAKGPPPPMGSVEQQ